MDVQALAHGEAIRFRQRLTAWLGVIVLAVNLFGWTLTPSAAALSPPPNTIAALFPEALSCQDICEHDGGGKSQHDGHDKMVCPACFPMGNASNGALISADADIPAPHPPIIARQARPESALARSSFHPLQYQARAPPRLA